MDDGNYESERDGTENTRIEFAEEAFAFSIFAVDETDGNADGDAP